MLKILGVGLPRTGTSSLCEALRILGFNAIHHAPERLNLDNLTAESFRAYDDVDAVTDAPACSFYRELGERYPGLQYILTVRDEESWWESIKWHINKIHASADLGHIRYSDQLHAWLFGNPYPNEYLYRRRFREHNEAVMQWVQERYGSGEGYLLVMDIHAGDKWDTLCPFLGVPIPDTEFPWLNKKTD